MTTLFVLLVIGFGGAFAEIFDSGEWQMTILELSELSEIYSDSVTYEGQSEKIANQLFQI